MVPNQIEKDILIEAPIDAVWRVITEPEQIREWFNAEAEVDGRNGGEGRLRFEGGDSYSLRVEAFEPPHRFAYRWYRDDEMRPRPDHAMLVEFTLKEEAGGTRLRLVESGFDQVDWSDETKTRYFEDHSGGWEFFLGRIRDHAASG